MAKLAEIHTFPNNANEVDKIGRIGSEIIITDNDNPPMIIYPATFATLPKYLRVIKHNAYAGISTKPLSAVPRYKSLLKLPAANVST